MRRLLAASVGAALLLVGLWCLAQAQQGQPAGPNTPCTAFGTTSGTCAQGNQLLSPPGTAVNIAASLSTAGTSITVTADSIQSCTSLTGSCYQLESYSQTFNGSNTGAGGMDTGSLPTSGFVALYAIYNPSTPATSILGYNCSSSCGTIYPGSHLPSGYTASALLTVLPTNSTPAIVVSYVRGRKVVYGGTTALSSSSSSVSCTSLSISSSVPPNAVAVSGWLYQEAGTTPSGSDYQLRIYSDGSCATGKIILAEYFSISSQNFSTNFAELPLAASQTLGYDLTNSGTSPSSIITINSYTIPGSP